MSNEQRKDEGVEGTHYDPQAEPDELTPDHWVESTPEPGENQAVVNPGAVAEHIEVPCPGCGNSFGFDIDSQVEGFTFQCTVCKTQTAWTRAGA